MAKRKPRRRKKSDLAERNRQNARHSTGPRTDDGKAITRANALKHGLCANPASGVVEDGGAFELLHTGLVQRLEPRDTIEAGLVHRIAVCLWRLQRAARIDAAITSLAAQAVNPQREEAQQWVERINDAWRVEYVRETDPVLIRKRIKSGKLDKGDVWWRLVRPNLVTLDLTRETRIMRSGAAITAMMVMLDDLAGRLRRSPFTFSIDDCEKLAWLLGESAERLPRDIEDSVRPDKRRRCTETDRLIGEARDREATAPLSAALETRIGQRLETLRQQRQFCEEPYRTEQWERERTAAMLPDTATLDRLIRYETHADRSLHRALESLARLRGTTVETIAATMTGRTAAGATVELHGERTHWRSGDPEVRR